MRNHFGVLSVIVILVCVIGVHPNSNINPDECGDTPTTVSGTKAPKGQICEGQLLLNEDFTNFDRDLWKHDLTLSGGGNWEFQWYVNDSKNSYVDDGKLFLRPSLTSDIYGEELITKESVKLDPCTDSEWDGCERKGTKDFVINPIRSARINTAGSFSFKYGRIEIVAKMPTGDWLWPGIWLLPTHKVYGNWPRSGEIDMAESRGNRQYIEGGQHIGVEHVVSTLHFGTSRDHDGYKTSTFPTYSKSGDGFNKGFHRYQMVWTPEFISFRVDGHIIGYVPADEGFWARGGFGGETIWAKGTRMAPFDQEFHIILNLAVGGVNGYFPDEGNESKKPWINKSKHAATDFWNGRNQWLPGWNLDKNNGRDASLIIDSVRVWAL